MAHIKTASDGTQKISMSTVEWIDIGLKRGLLSIDPRAPRFAANLAKSAGLQPGKASYTTIKKAMQNEEIMAKIAKNLERSALIKTAQQVGENTGGPGWGTAALGAAGLAAAAPLAFQGGRDMYRNIGAGLSSAGNSSAQTMSGLGSAFGQGFGGNPVGGAATSFGNIAKGVGNFAARAAMPALGLAGGFLGSKYLINHFKDKLAGDSAPSPQLMADPQKQKSVMRSIYHFNQLAPTMKGMSSSIDKQLDTIAAAVTDTIQKMQEAQNTVMTPTIVTPEEQRAKEIADAQAAQNAAQAAYMKSMAGPQVQAPAGLPSVTAPAS
jgi:hypothetical protein